MGGARIWDAAPSPRQSEHHEQRAIEVFGWLPINMADDAPNPVTAESVTRPTDSAIHLQRGDKGFLRDVNLAELPHLLLAFLLLLQKLSFARDVAAIALCGDVLAQRAHGFARDHLAADRRLDRNLEQ